MSEENTQDINGGRSFEERVFGRFDAMDTRFNAIDARFDAMDARFDAMDTRFDGVDSAIRDLDSRVERLEIRSYDTKPIWERALKEILETKREVLETKRDLTKRLDRLVAITYDNRADLRDVEERLDKLESKPNQ